MHCEEDRHSPSSAKEEQRSPFEYLSIEVISLLILGDVRIKFESKLLEGGFGEWFKELVQGMHPVLLVGDCC